jgi:hypothetical protein
MLTLSAALVAAGAASLEARADGSAVSRESRPPAVQRDSGEEHDRLSAQPLAAKLASKAGGPAVGGTSKATSKVTYMNGSTDAQADVEIDL